MTSRQILAWLGAGAVGVALLVWSHPRAYPFFPGEWRTSKAEAEAIGFELATDLGPAPPGLDVYSNLAQDSFLERRLQLATEEGADAEAIGDSALARQILFWQVSLYAPGAADSNWSYRAGVALDGTLLSLQRRVPPERQLPAIDPAEARRRADVFLSEQGFDLSRFAEPEARTQDRAARRDLGLRYRHRENALGDALPYGVEVLFAGDVLTGFASWYDDARQGEIQRSLQGFLLLNQAWIFFPLPLCLVVGAFFLRRYHAGEIGVRRAVQLFAFLLVSGLAFLVLSASGASALGGGTGVLSRAVRTWAFGAQILLLFFLPLALLSALSWSVGESLCRERWGHKLAAFDALFQGDWTNATVARSALRGVVSGALLAGGLTALLAVLPRFGGWGQAAFLVEPWWPSAHWPGLALLLFTVPLAIYFEVFGRLLLLPPAVRRLGPWLGGALVAVVSGLLVWPSVIVLPLGWGVPLWIAAAAVLVALFLRYDLLTSALAALAVHLLPGAWTLLQARDPSLQLQGSLALAIGALPLLLSVRDLMGGREFHYRYDDVPPHVRRIAERERQKVELETARRIQSSILPELPPEIQGVRLAHAYHPATEVGGDFYDVLALEDGRLAVAVGDVAGHGVSSGLVMSMAKSALSVQVTFDPEVESVIGTLNRLVYQSARRRLLATLCYALIDPLKREMTYASAGHLFPYRLSGGGSVEALESVSYPLGVRERLDVRVRAARLEPGDAVCLFSDGIIEARAEGSDDLFGFDRLEETLGRLAGSDVLSIRDGVLADLEAFTHGAPLEDDLTLLVLRLP